MDQQNYALGMIETIGFPGLVAAVDTAAKSSDVKLKTMQRADGGIITVYIIGDVASVKVAVEVGAEAAKRVGHLNAKHVIPRPDENLIKVLLERPDEKKTDSPKKKPVNKTPTAPPVTENLPKHDEKKALPDYNNMSLSELRNRAESSKEISLTVNQVKKAKKDELIKHLSDAQSKKGGDK